MKRFVQEYASYKIKCWRENDLMNPVLRDKCGEIVAKYLQAYDAGLISTEETMRVLVDIEKRAIDELDTY